jgi:hypothetical protein
MAYILTEQLLAGDGASAASAFARYREYVASVRDRLPHGALELATSEWYFDSRDHRCPHDAWLESAEVSESGSGQRLQNRKVAVRIRLLGAYHDGHIEFQYRGVVRYRIELGSRQETASGGHRDWRYDEFRLAPSGGVVHEIEWWGSNATGTWLIEATDVAYRWIPLGASARPHADPDA